MQEIKRKTISRHKDHIRKEYKNSWSSLRKHRKKGKGKRRTQFQSTKGTLERGAAAGLRSENARKEKEEEGDNFKPQRPH